MFFVLGLKLNKFIVMNNWIKSKLRGKGLMVRKLVIILMVLLTVHNMSAADNDVSVSTSESVSVSSKPDNVLSRNLFVELFGPSLGIGIGYDQRFKPNSAFGFRAGLSYTNGSSDDDGWFGAYDGGPHTYIEFKGVTLPLEANAIMGKRASKFELGLGATPCILNRYEEKYKGWHHTTVSVKKGVKLNIFGTMNIGYRLQRKSGFFLRTGLSFLIGDIKCSPFDGLFCMPYLSLGYTIR